MAEIDREKVIREFGNWCEAMADECPIICLRVRDLLEEQEEQIKTRDESLEKAREEIKWLRGMLKEQEKRINDLEEKLRLLEYGDQDILQSGMMPAT